MTNDELNAALMEWRGWTIEKIASSGMYDVAVLPPGCELDGFNIFRFSGITPPDYCENQNDITEAIEFLFVKDHRLIREYGKNLLNEICPNEGDAFRIAASIARASPKQKAVALAKTIGVWRE